MKQTQYNCGIFYSCKSKEFLVNISPSLLAAFLTVQRSWTSFFTKERHMGKITSDYCRFRWPCGLNLYKYTLFFLKVNPLANMIRINILHFIY